MSSCTLRSEYLRADKQRDKASAGISLAILALLCTGVPLLCCLCRVGASPCRRRCSLAMMVLRN